jgi:preprotein translocase subunit YajC
MIFLLIGALFWFLILGPERKNKKRRQAMLDALSKGDEVMTTGGLFGRVSKVDEHEVILVVADGVRLRFSRAAVQGLRDEEDEPDGSDDGKKS